MMLLRVTYGVDPSETDHKYYDMVESIAEIADDIAVPGRYPVEALPVLRSLPSWVPGGGFKKYAADAKVSIAAALDELYKTAVDGLVSRLSREIASVEVFSLMSTSAERWDWNGLFRISPSRASQ